MRYGTRLSLTLRLILLSLVPAVAHGLTLAPSPIPDSSTMSPEELMFCLRNPERVAGLTEGRAFRVPGVFPQAAPFVLFRLKRWGFSGCRVTVHQDGLCIEARR